MPWPLLAILAAQAGLSARLAWSNTAFSDEALYLWAGHLEVTHLLYHVPVPGFQTYLSGSPVIYPIVGAIADGYGGLAAARGLALAFMLGATALLYLTAARLFGWRAGVAAAAVFVALGPVQALGAFATYDAMAIFLLALAAWLTVRASGRAGELLLVAAALAMALADATKYASALWDPVIISLAAVTSRQTMTRSLLRSLRLTLYAATPLLALARLAGPSYLHGVMITTLHRQIGDATATVASIAGLTWSMTGILITLGVCACVVSFTETVRTRVLCGVLTSAALLAPAHQAQIRVQTALSKHLVFGAWFCAIAAGYVLARAAGMNRKRGWRVPAAAATVIVLAGVPQASAYFRGWASSARTIPVLRSAISNAGCPCLAFQWATTYYYLAPGVRPGELTDPYFFTFRAGHRNLTGLRAYQAAIRAHYFHVVEADPAGNARLFPRVVAALAATPGYRLVISDPSSPPGLGRTEVWEFQPPHARHPRIEPP
jgi:4-amino-4-deoxy-L-arabinose transferase-like glycosyltransferase